MYEAHKEKFGHYPGRKDDDLDRLASALKEITIEERAPWEAVAEHIKSGVQNIIVLTGAGLSTVAGIPDFRTPGTGLYDNLQKYNLPHPVSSNIVQILSNIFFTDRNI